MATPAKSTTKAELKEQKRQIKSARKEQKLTQKLTQKLAKREEKLARKQARREQRATVGYKALLQREDAIRRLEEIVNGLKSGTVTLEQNDQKLELKAPDAVHVNVRARQRYKSEGIRITLRWPRNSAEKS